MSFDIVVRDNIASSIVKKLRDIQRYSRSASGSLERMNRAISSTGRNSGLVVTNRSFTTLASNIARTNTQLGLLNTGFTRATTSARRLLSGFLLLQGASSFIGKLDDFQNIENRLKRCFESS